MRNQWLGVLVVLSAASLAQAQHYPAYYNGGYYPSYPQQAQYGYNPYQASGYSPYGSNYNYQRYNYNPYYYASNPGSANYYYPQQANTYYVPTTPAYTPAPAYAPSAYAPTTTVVPAEPPVDPYSPYRYVAQELKPPPVTRHEEPVYQAPPLLDDTIPFHRPCKDLFWVSADYLAAFIRPMRLAGPLVTTGSAADPQPAALGAPHTSVLFGNDPIDFNMSSGFQASAGIFLDKENHFSLDIGGFVLFQNTKSFNIASDNNGNPVLGRPVFNTLPVPPGPGNNALLNSFPAEANGTLGVDAQSQLFGLEINARYHTYCWGHLHADALFGLKYTKLWENLTIKETLNPLQNDGFVTFQGNGIAPPNSFADTDSFSTSNQFWGAQIGGRLSWEYRWLNLETFAKLAIGANSQQVTIDGTSTLVTPAGNNQSAPGGVLALPSNIGTHNRTVFGILPQLGFNVGVDVTDHCRVNLGYSCLMWNNVVRPGMEIPTSVNAGQIPGSPNFGAAGGAVAPTFHWSSEFFVVNQLNIGMMITY